MRQADGLCLDVYCSVEIIGLKSGPREGDASAFLPDTFLVH